VTRVAPPRQSTAPSPSVVTLPELEPAPPILDFLDHRFPRVGHEVWRRRLAEGKVLSGDGTPVTLETPYRAHARLLYFREVDDELRIPFEEEILYRDDDLLVADKPHFLNVTPGGGAVNECLLYRLRRRTGLPDLVPVHRLDRATAGLVLCAVRRESRAALTELFARRWVLKEYLAVAPVPEPPQHQRAWTVANRLVPGEPPFRMREAPEGSGEPNAVTRIELLEIHDGRGLFHLTPETGKRHQLRIHLASLGFPILHERYYPELQPERPVDFSRPLQLLAWRLSFPHPATGEEKVFTSERGLAGWPLKPALPRSARSR
jgi:tRNA pseudouridine32 synthase/23S rRNA pseudouridine746 synthase